MIIFLFSHDVSKEACMGKGLTIKRTLTTTTKSRVSAGETSRETSRKERMMRRRKPDFMIVLVTLIGLGVLITGISQEMMRNAAEDRLASNAILSQH